MDPIVIIAALHDEVSSLVGDPAFKWVEQEPGILVSPQGVALGICGVGKVNAAFMLGKMWHLGTQVLSLGTSGGLGQQNVGDIYVCTNFVEHDMDASAMGLPKGVTPFSESNNPIINCNSEEWATALSKACSAVGTMARKGLTMSGDQFIGTDEVLQAKIADFGADLVDMEAAGLAKICQRYNRPFAALRYITDNANHDAKESWTDNVHRATGLFSLIIHRLLDDLKQ